MPKRVAVAFRTKGHGEIKILTVVIAAKESSRGHFTLKNIVKINMRNEKLKKITKTI